MIPIVAVLLSLCPSSPTMHDPKPRSNGAITLQPVTSHKATKQHRETQRATLLEATDRPVHPAPTINPRALFLPFLYPTEAYRYSTNLT
ncbi:hypothetical protein BKA59DRAFT_113083 [Fusarium tricinctum]|uniref:Secreted protein n=1 Tax=Fusarium tricinctum TaxID=61284 RepID=A0A8K0WG86_9HYPO|nr:hypothetical protein BKA59DRAFT_113083 [Fusarium tricinctum]